MFEDFPARKRKARVIPWGYKVSTHDPDWLEPIITEVQAFDRGLQYLKTCSYEQVAKWLSVKTGRYISQPGLLYMVKKIKLERARRYESTRKVKKRQLRIVERELPAQA